MLLHRLGGAREEPAHLLLPVGTMLSLKYNYYGPEEEDQFGADAVGGGAHAHPLLAPRVRHGSNRREGRYRR